MSIWSRLLEFPLTTRVGASLEALWRALSGRGNESSGDGSRMDGGVAFTIAMVALAAKMARADGDVTPSEVGALHRLFSVPERERQNVQRFFDIARQSMVGFDSYARDVARLFADRPGVLEDVLDGLFSIAMADGGIHPNELAYLALAADIFGFSDAEFARIRVSHLDPDSDPYRVLGLDPDCDDEELRQSYRRLVRENHPDSLMGRGVPAEFVAVANGKLAAINRAYHEVRQMRASA